VVPFSVTVSVPTGSVEELSVIEVSNWVGRAFSFARTPPVLVKSEIECHSGIYLLTGESLDDLSEGQLYIGESENLLSRLQNHTSNPDLDFWTRTHCFTSSNKMLNKGYLRFLESELLRSARNAATWTVANATLPASTGLAQADEIAARSFLETLLRIAPIMGISAFSQPKSVGTARLKLTGPDASAEGEDQPGGFLVFAGSRARLHETPTLQKARKNLRRRLVREGRLVADGPCLALTHDHLFTSPSVAASVFLARSANGRTEWKDETGRTLRELQESETAD
jgi:hypothetical protein